MDPRIELYKAAVSQPGAGFDIPVFTGISRYQYGHVLGDVLRGLWPAFQPVMRLLKQVVIKGPQTLLKTGSEAI